MLPTRVASSCVTIQIDRAAARGEVTLPAWISVGGVDDARAILGSMLGAVSTVLALIFSVALLVLSMAVSQFGPRILYASCATWHHPGDHRPFLRYLLTFLSGHKGRQTREFVGDCGDEMRVSPWSSCALRF